MIDVQLVSKVDLMPAVGSNIVAIRSINRPPKRNRLNRIALGVIMFRAFWQKITDWVCDCA